MRIEQFRLSNFKCFNDQTVYLHPRFTLFVGENGAGKSSILDGLSVAAGSWLLGIPGQKARSIHRHEVTLGHRSYSVDSGGAATKANVQQSSWEPQFPSSIWAQGEVLGQTVQWRRARNGPSGRTTYREAKRLKDLSRAAAREVSEGEGLLPLIANYGVCRLCDAPRDRSTVANVRALTDKKQLSRLAGYDLSIDPRISVPRFVRWVARQSWIAFQQGEQATPAYQAVAGAVTACMPGATDLRFDPAIGEVVLVFRDAPPQPFNNLSDGQRSILAMVGDIATRAATLNPQLGPEALTQTPGIVLIDEIDLHLHPKWQRRIADDLKRTFPSLQFVCTTHSPQVIGELSRDEVRLLQQGEPVGPPVARGADSNWILDHVMQGASSQTAMAREHQDAVDDALDDDNFDLARKKLGDLRELLDGDTAQLTALETRVSAMERLARDDGEDEV